jgi:hypothetical protein
MAQKVYCLKVLESNPSTHDISLFYAVLGKMWLYDRKGPKIGYKACTGQKPALGQQMSKQDLFLKSLGGCLGTPTRLHPNISGKRTEVVRDCTPNVFYIFIVAIGNSFGG